MGGHADGDHPFLRRSAQGPLVEEAGLYVGFDQAVQRQDRRQQGRHPDHPATSARQQFLVWPHREGEQHGDRQEEQDRQHSPAAPALAQQQAGEVSAEDGP